MGPMLISSWETREGVRFLRRIGIRRGQAVMDFGCRVGRYSIPAALAVGEEGVVYAVDKDADALRELGERAGSLGLRNIRLLHITPGRRLDVRSESVDAVLLYDVLHYMDGSGRRRVYMEMRRILRASGLLSVYPKHVSTDEPADHFRSLSVDDVRREIERSGFVFQARLCGTLSHDEGLNQGCVLNFGKREEASR